MSEQEEQEYLDKNKDKVMIAADIYFKDSRCFRENNNQTFDELSEERKRYFIRDAEIHVLMIRSGNYE